MIKLLVLILVLASTSEAVMPTIAGKIYIKSTTLANAIDNDVKTYKQYCLQNKTVDIYNISTTSGTVKTLYRIEVYLNFNEMSQLKYDELLGKIRTYIGNSNVESANIKIWMSHNNGNPGYCQPDTISEIITK